MLFYLFKDDDGKLLGYLQSPVTISMPNAHEVSEAQFKAAGGIVEPERIYSDPQEDGVREFVLGLMEGYEDGE